MEKSKEAALQDDEIAKIKKADASVKTWKILQALLFCMKSLFPVCESTIPPPIYL